MGLSMTTPANYARYPMGSGLAERLRAPRAPSAVVSVHPGDGAVIVVSRLPSYAPNDLDIGKPYRVEIVRTPNGGKHFKLYDGATFVCYQGTSFWWHASWTVRAEG